MVLRFGVRQALIFKKININKTSSGSAAAPGAAPNAAPSGDAWDQQF